MAANTTAVTPGDGEKNVSTYHEYPSSPDMQHLERADSPTGNLVYDEADEEPELHGRTFIAVAAMLLLNLIQVFALQGPPVVVRVPN